MSRALLAFLSTASIFPSHAPTFASTRCTFASTSEALLIAWSVSAAVFLTAVSVAAAALLIATCSAALEHFSRSSASMLPRSLSQAARRPVPSRTRRTSGICPTTSSRHSRRRSPYRSCRQRDRLWIAAARAQRPWAARRLLWKRPCSFCMPMRLRTLPQVCSLQTVIRSLLTISFRRSSCRVAIICVTYLAFVATSFLTSRFRCVRSSRRACMWLFFRSSIAQVTSSHRVSYFLATVSSMRSCLSWTRPTLEASSPTRTSHACSANCSSSHFLAWSLSALSSASARVVEELVKALASLLCSCRALLWSCCLEYILLMSCVMPSILCRIRCSPPRNSSSFSWRLSCSVRDVLRLLSMPWRVSASFFPRAPRASMSDPCWPRPSRSSRASLACSLSRASVLGSSFASDSSRRAVRSPCRCRALVTSPRSSLSTCLTAASSAAAIGAPANQWSGPGAWRQP
mmetsp:Transcript_18972/g.53506  ORF Transcript_18972/g.53506 Transcript_18972/m.53506 type:complete len:459 (+) Transcript_18972:1149-2525(+)